MEEIENNFKPTVKITIETTKVNVKILGEKELTNNKGKKFTVIEVLPEICFILDKNNNLVDAYYGELDEDENNLRTISGL